MSSITSQVVIILNDSFFEMQHNFMGQGHWEALKKQKEFIEKLVKLFYTNMQKW